MVSKGLTASVVVVNDELVQVLLPRMAIDHLDWEEVKQVAEIKNSDVLRSFKTHIRNMKKEPELLDSAAKKSKEAIAHVEESDDGTSSGVFLSSLLGLVGGGCLFRGKSFRKRGL